MNVTLEDTAPPPPKEVVIRMSIQEATLLRGWLTNLHRDGDLPNGYQADDLRKLLNKVLVS